MLQWDRMKNTIEQTGEEENGYKEKLNILISQNRSFFITGAITLIFIIYIFLLQIGGQAITQFRYNILSFISNNFNRNVAPTSPDLTNRITNKSIDYISPINHPSGAQIDENGQISAISSGKVTYTKNKYTVKKGDSLASIALQAYGDRDAWVRIAQANNLASPDLIEVGMELVIPR